MNKKLSHLKVFFLSGILLVVMFTGCVEKEPKPEKEELLTPDVHLDQPSILPDWKDGDYHDYYRTKQILKDFKDKFPDLADVYSIGNSVLGKDIWCIRITNENNNGVKSSCLIDGCIHGDEWESGDACLYLAEYLLINFGKNATITHILNTSKVYLVPLVNPDGRQQNTRWNDNGVDLNRNFDIYFGRLRCKSLRIGKLFGRIKIPVVKFFSNNPYKYFWNCGRRAFSEPETRAIRGLMQELDRYEDFSFYVNCHTALHTIVTPWLTFKPPFEMTLQEKNVFNYAKKWVEENTEYEGYWGGKRRYGGLPMDWGFKEFRIPCFLFEILPLDYDPWLGEGKHDNLVHWMKTTIPVFMYFLINIDNLRQWKTPDIKPLLPEDISPVHFQ